MAKESTTGYKCFLVNKLLCNKILFILQECYKKRGKSKKNHVLNADKRKNVVKSAFFLCVNPLHN